MLEEVEEKVRAHYALEGADEETKVEEAKVEENIEAVEEQIFVTDYSI